MTRWEGPSRRRLFSPPPTSAWDRDDRPRAREPLPPSRAQEREEEKPRQVSIPPAISWFVGDLPSASSFDGDFSTLFFWRGGGIERKADIFLLIGPVFRTDDLLNLSHNAVIPSMTTQAKLPPCGGQSNTLSSQSFTKGGGGGQPPDYGPYQGLNSG